MIFHTTDSRGFTLVEVIIASAIILLFVSVLASALTFYVRILPERVRYVQADFLATEGIEAAKQLRDESWSTNIASLQTGSDYYLYFTGSDWTLTTEPQTIDGIFTRVLQFDQAYRDGGDNLSSSGIADPNTRKLVVTVSWDNKSGNESLTTYITNLLAN